eukprot:gnl/MRDRNA2_/MRDRNA2_71874_c0_seq1.p1 gnl/MRDRNA2_/MRDRNA2_71874_c0~~gnl/MRDRNA2_/MRDRNA2_71874_c0_seq1.p1  ORF type:complete len:660 (+),score=105.73 gnl/MRDRNA2_/MRDRNA2_71874_c0_seq1:116-2095(+)
MVLKNVRQQGTYLEDMLETIRKTPASAQAVTVHILAAADHDGLCSSYMLQALLCRGCAAVKYLTLPVTCNAEVLNHISELHSEEYEDVRCLILLNCGGNIDIAGNLQEHKVPDHVCCYIVDCHRPYNLENVYAPDGRVVVVDDDRANEDGTLIPSPLASDDEESDEDDLEKEGAEGHSFEERQDAKRRRLDREESRRQRRDEKLERRIAKAERKQEYYGGSYYATPVALSLHKMAMKDGMLSQDLLWLAAMSLAGYHDAGLISDMTYDQLAWDELKEALDRFGDPNPSQGSIESQGRTSADDFMAGVGGRNRAGNLEIRFEKALAMTLYKHWTLEQAMHHTPSIFGTLGLQWDRGIRQLLSFFAIAGIEPKQFRQMYSGMSLDVRKTLHRRVKHHGLRYGIDEKVFWPQFFRDIGQIGDTASALYLNELSASDGAHVLNSILTDIPFRLSSSQIESLPTLDDGTLDMNRVQDMERKALIDNFGRAGGALLYPQRNYYDLLKEGITTAVDITKEIVGVAKHLIDIKGIRVANNGAFRWCKVEHPPHVLRHHLIVRKLATWLIRFSLADTTVDKSQKMLSSLPLLVIVRDTVSKTYRCVGAIPHRGGERNLFGLRFRTALKSLGPGVRFRYDYFDRDTVEVMIEDFDRFFSVLIGSREGNM